MEPNNLAVKTWENLSTLTSFDSEDGGNNESNQDNSNTTHVVDTANLVNILKTKASTPISLLVESLVQQLCSMLEQDPQKANNLYRVICERLHNLQLIDATYGMSEFEVMRGQYQRALYQLVTVARGVQSGVGSGEMVWPLPESIGQHNGFQYSMEWSRYYREFDELDFIAGGGFGRVYKTRHKLDGSEYAVKKICIKSSTVNHVMTHLSEVKTLASLNHVNIVPYKAAWLEPLLESNVPENSEKTDITGCSTSTGCASIDITSSVKVSTNNDTSDFINFTDSRSDINDSKITESEPDSNVFFDKSPAIDSNAVCMYGTKLDIQNKAHLNLKWATLFIQMSLCQSTLRQWLDKRNKIGADAFYREFKPPKMSNLKIKVELTALNTTSGASIQETAYTHNDLTNLNDAICNLNLTRNNTAFANTEESEFSCAAEITNAHRNVLQNNFHLVTNITESDHSNLLHVHTVIEIITQLTNGLHYIHSKGIVHHDIKPSNVFIGCENNLLSVQLGDFGLACPLKHLHSGVGLGTPLYAGPEQLEGECNFKSDIYSLGIILLELLLTFSTDMERVKTITEFRKGILPSELISKYPPFVEFMRNVIKKRPSSRPDTAELLRQLDILKCTYSNVKCDKDGEILDLKNKMYVMNEQMKNKDEEIQKLRNMISMMKK